MADVSGQVRGKRLRLFVYDLSMDGCMLQTSRSEVAEGEKVILQFDESCTAIGKVLWRKNLNVGLKFERRLEPEVVDRLVTAAADNVYAQGLIKKLDRSMLKVENRKIDPPRF